MLTSTISACLPQNPPPATAEITQIPELFPQSYYQQALLNDKQVLRIDSNASLITVIVRRAGLLARLGHDHVVASHDLQGWVDVNANRADLYFPLDKLVVDEPALRAEAGFSNALSAEAIAGTRNNMLYRVLDAERYPFVHIRASRRPDESSKLTVLITLHGTEKPYDVPVQTVVTPKGMTLSGSLSLKQSDYGVVPFSILGGAMQVQDEIDLTFRIVASRIDQD